ncbi:MAG: hypothetical protein DMF53_06675 [Acidobacteria bacterium]|nr:MAG: hypothetical protein DMF53_06675 [Acidobacteriota bacterium]
MAFRQAEPPQSALVLQSGMWVQPQRQKPWNTVVDAMNSGCAVGRDNRYSKSKFQIAIWFAIVIIAYVSTLWLRWWGCAPLS